MNDATSPAPLDWAAIESLRLADPVQWRERVAACGAEFPPDVFAQLEAAAARPMELGIGTIDWRGVHWSSIELSGRALLELDVASGAAPSVDAARVTALEQGVVHACPAVVAQWHDAGTWLRGPVLADGDVVRRAIPYQLLVGHARLGTLCGLIERGEVSIDAKHRVWVGRRRRTLTPR